MLITPLDAPDDALDPQERKFVANIREYGWVKTAVTGDAEGSGFSFTTGFWVRAGAPELIMYGMKPDIAHDVFWGLFRSVEAGQPLPIGKRTSEIFANLSACLFPVAKRYYADYLGWSRWFYGNDDFPCLQIVWPDRDNIFPWENGFDPAFIDDQPDLTEQGWAASFIN